MRKSVEIELFGRKVLLFERSAADVLELYEFHKSSDGKFGLHIFEFAMQISDALKPNLKTFWDKKTLGRKFKPGYLIKNLSPAQLLELSEKVSELEGNKKKVTETASQSEETLPVP